MEELFSLDGSGNIVYDGEEVTNYGNSDILFDGDDSRNVVSDAEETSEDVQTSDTVSIDSDTGVLSSDGDISLLAVGSPTSGTMSSTTIDYFDRVIDGLPSNYGYVAYKTSNDDTYAGSLIYGRDYDVNDNSIVFGKGAVEVALSRYYDSNRNWYLSYTMADASDTSINLPDSGTLLYYTNLVDGRPTLGRGTRPFETGLFVAIGLVCVLVAVVISRLVKGR